MSTWELIECPYCLARNEVIIKSDWERPKCYNCNGVYYVEIIQKVSVSSFGDQGQGSEATTEGSEV